MVESLTRESWYWTEGDFKQLNPRVNIDFQGSYFMAASYFLWGKLYLVFSLFLTYALISITNALFIRISIKCSILMIFPMMVIQN